MLIGTVNAYCNHVGVRVSRDRELVVTRVHPLFAEAVRSALVEPLPRR